MGKERLVNFRPASKSSFVPIVAMAALAAAMPPVQAQNNPTDGAALFKAKCALCHGPDGTGKTRMGQKLNLRDLHSAEVQKHSDADLTHVIGQGKGKMPAFAKTLSKDKIKLLATYVRELGKK
jgi:mono/diheme cytochrome c family protein